MELVTRLSPQVPLGQNRVKAMPGASLRLRPAAFSPTATKD